MKSKILKSIFAIWVVILVSAAARELFIKSNLHDYEMLFARSLEGKRSYVTGDAFYEFLIFSKNNLPTNSTYELIGVEDDSLDKRRAAYYLYPNLVDKDPEFILIYNTPDVTKVGYRTFIKLDNDKYILQRKKG